MLVGCRWSSSQLQRLELHSHLGIPVPGGMLFLLHALPQRSAGILQWSVPAENEKQLMGDILPWEHLLLQKPGIKPAHFFPEHDILWFRCIQESQAWIQLLQAGRCRSWNKKSCSRNED